MQYLQFSFGAWSPMFWAREETTGFKFEVSKWLTRLHINRRHLLSPKFCTASADTLASIGQAAFVARGMEARMREMEKLRRMSDAELDALGIRRDEIAAHVFKDVFYT